MIEEQEKKAKSLGNVMNLKLDLTDPIKMNFDMQTLKEVTLLVGQNGSGKTMINKIVFFASFVTVIDLAVRNGQTPPEFAPFAELGKFAQYVFDNTFTEPTEFSGKITVHFENGSLTCDIEKGSLSKVMTTYDQDVTEGTYPKYMSATTRLFSSMEAILAMSDTMQDDVLKYYKLYDIMHCVRMRHFAQNISTLDEDLVHQFKEDYDFDVVALKYDKGKFLYTDSKGVTKLATTLGAGHQSILNMFVGVRA